MLMITTDPIRCHTLDIAVVENKDRPKFRKGFGVLGCNIG